jgi:hypothetical protein
LARHGRAVAAGEQGKAVSESLAKRLEREHVHARGGQLDREGNAVEPAAEVGDDRRAFRGEREPVVYGARAVDEENH